MVGGDDWPIGYVVDRASQVAVGSILGNYVVGGADLASVVFVQLVDHDPFICSGSLAD